MHHFSNFLTVQLVFLHCDRSVEFHSQHGHYYKTRIPTFGRDFSYHYPSSDLYFVGKGWVFDTRIDFNTVPATLTGLSIIYQLHHIGITWLGDKVDVFLSFFSVQRCLGSIWNRDVSSTLCRLMLCKFKTVSEQ